MFMQVEEDEHAPQPSFWALLDELRIVTTIPTFLIIVLQVSLTHPCCACGLYMDMMIHGQC